MSGFRDKLQVFFLGLMLGLLIGGGFFILKLDNYFKELSFHKSAQDEEDSEGEEMPVTDEKQASPQKSAKDISAPVVKKQPKDSAMTNIAVPAAVTDTVTMTADSISPMEKMSDGGEIIVRKDEMTAAQTVEVINLSLSANAKSPKDSLLQQVSGMRDDAKSSLRIEFWRSPLNYKGYKMTRNKIVVYGISSSDPVSVFKLDDEIYMKHLNTAYRLTFSNDFRQFEKVSDAGILSRLNK